MTGYRVAVTWYCDNLQLASFARSGSQIHAASDDEEISVCLLIILNSCYLVSARLLF